MGTYSDLKSDVFNWMNSRSDLVPFIPGFIRSAESDLNTKLRTYSQLKTVVLTPNADSKITFPDDYLAFRSVVALTNPRTRLDHVVSGAIDQMYPIRQAGWPTSFSILQDKTALILPATTNNIELQYYAKIPALSEDNPTNFVLDNSYNTYLFGALKYAALFISDTERMGLFTAQFIDNLTLLEKTINAGLYGERTTYRSTTPKP